MIIAMATDVSTDSAGGVSLREFGAWMTAEQRRITLLCRRMLRDEGEADSAAQEIFVKAFQALRSKGMNPGDLDKPDKWLTRIAVNECLDRLRSATWKFWQRRPAAADEEAILQMTPSRTPDAERQAMAGEIQRHLERALDKLSGKQRAAFSLRHFEDLPLDEIASLLQCDVGTVKSHLSRAMGKLRVELKDFYFSSQTGRTA